MGSRGEAPGSSGVIIEKKVMNSFKFNVVGNIFPENLVIFSSIL